MKTMKRLFSLALVLALAVSALTGCGGGDGSASSADPAGSAPSDSSADPAEALDLSQITDPYLATSGLAGDTVVARAGDQDITAAQLLYWLNYGAELYLVSSGATSVDDLPWDTDLGDGVTFADQMKQSALDAAAFYALLPTVAQGRACPSPRRPWTPWRSSAPRCWSSWGATRPLWSTTSGIRCSPGTRCPT